METVRISGSEAFRYRPTPLDELRAAAGVHMPVHQVTAEQIAAIDPLTYEVVRHRLWAITDEMGEVIKRMSGSVVVTDANDFGVSLMNELGQQVQIGAYNPSLSVSMGLAVEWTLLNRAENPGIADGDMFICNDPWIGGGLHQNDVALFAPVFWEGEIFAWTCAVAHQLDLGGVSPGSWSVESRDVFWESLPIPPLKIVEAGRIRSDVEDSYLRRSRVPKLVALDLRAKVGANNLAHDRLLRLLRKYGPTTVKAVMEKVMDTAEQRLRGKLDQLPDGEWSGVAYQDQARLGDRGMHKIQLTLTKRGQLLTFDFTGTDPQVTGLINCTYTGLFGGIMVPILSLLCGDIPWAPGGIKRCIEVISEPGTINNCTFPAGISKASVASTWATSNAAYECISGLLDTDDAASESLMSVCKGSAPICLLSGTDQRHEPFVTMLTDHIAGGLGARASSDGVDTGGSAMMSMPRTADVEMNEFCYPLLYLWRREEPDSGGPGRHRGGLSGSVCFILHDTVDRELRLTISASGKAVPQASGLSGGYPANTQVDLLVRDSNIRDLIASGGFPGTLEPLEGGREVVQTHMTTTMQWNDVLYTHWQGGGGYGDPLRRAPHQVAADVEHGKVSVENARRTYGVELTEAGDVDEPATERLRERLGLRAGTAGPSSEPGDQRLDDNLLMRGESVLCRHCGHEVGTGEKYLAAAAWHVGSPDGAGGNYHSEPGRFVDAEIVFRQASCPGCGTRLFTEIAPADDPVTRSKRVLAAPRR